MLAPLLAAKSLLLQILGHKTLAHMLTLRWEDEDVMILETLMIRQVHMWSTHLHRFRPVDITTPQSWFLWETWTPQRFLSVFRFLYSKLTKKKQTNSETLKSVTKSLFSWAWKIVSHHPSPWQRAVKRSGNFNVELQTSVGGEATSSSTDSPLNEHDWRASQFDESLHVISVMST